jgi:hypothetical protein
MTIPNRPQFCLAPNLRHMPEDVKLPANLRHIPTADASAPEPSAIPIAEQSS